MKRALGTTTLLMLLAACGQTTTPATQPAPPPASVPAPVAAAPAPQTPLATTIDEARALRRAGNVEAYERSLRELALTSDADVSRRARALLGLYLHEQKRWDDSITSLTEAANVWPEVAPVLRLRIASAEDARGDAAAAARVLTQIIATAPETSAAAIARLRLPGLYAAANDMSSADAAYRQVATIAIDELTEEELVSLATRLAKANRNELANEIRMRLLNDYTSGRFTEQTYARLTQVADSPIDALTLEQSIALAQKLSKANRYDQTLDLLGRIAKRFPDSQTAELYRATRIRALFNSRNYTTLLAETETVTLTDPALMMLRARAAWRDDRPQDFLAGLAAIEQQFPKSKEAIDAKVQRAKYYQTDARDLDRSIADLQAAIDAGAVGSDGENLWTLGWTYLQQGKDDEALKTFERYIRTYPDGDYKTNSLFWSAKTLDRLGRAEERDVRARQVIVEYPFSYYAYRTKELWPGVANAPAAGAPFPDVNAQLATITDPRLATIRALQSIDLHRDATRETKALAEANPDNLGAAFLLANVYVEGGEPFKANSILQRRFRDWVRHGGTNIPQRFWEILFPLPYYDAIKTEAEKRNLDPYLVASIIRQESGFEPTTVSNAGAVGLMQIMPHEAGQIGTAAGISGVTRETLFDPPTNIALGAAEYSQKLVRMNGSQPLAIASYNAGESVVSEWLTRTPATDIDVFIESIPYAETKLYVKTVTRNQNEYRRIYGR